LTTLHIQPGKATAWQGLFSSCINNIGSQGKEWKELQ